MLEIARDIGDRDGWHRDYPYGFPSLDVHRWVWLSFLVLMRCPENVSVCLHSLVHRPVASLGYADWAPSSYTLCDLGRGYCWRCQLGSIWQRYVVQLKHKLDVKEAAHSEAVKTWASLVLRYSEGRQSASMGHLSWTFWYELSGFAGRAFWGQLYDRMVAFYASYRDRQGDRLTEPQIMLKISRAGLVPALDLWTVLAAKLLLGNLEIPGRSAYFARALIEMAPKLAIRRFPVHFNICRQREDHLLWALQRSIDSLSVRTLDDSGDADMLGPFGSSWNGLHTGHVGLTSTGVAVVYHNLPALEVEVLRTNIHGSMAFF